TRGKMDCFAPLAMTVFEACFHIPAARSCPSDASHVALEEKRAQGMPDAGRTREPCVQKSVHSAHARNHRAAATTGTPCAMVLTAAPCSPRCTGLVSHRRLAKRPARLDPSVGGTGPHGLAVREDAFVRARAR